MIGLIGGLGPGSTIDYYKTMNDLFSSRTGVQDAMPVIIYSADYRRVVQWEKEGDWVSIGTHLAAAAKRLEAAGCSCVMIACNSVHHDTAVAIIESMIRIPLLHIADASITACVKLGIKKIGLLGTNYTTASESFFLLRLRAHGIEVVVNEQAARSELHRIIFEELCEGRVERTSVTHQAEMVTELHRQGAEAVLLACTELSMLAKGGECSSQTAAECPLLDTAAIHAAAAVDLLAPEAAASCDQLPEA